jgi:hypothetical protein
MIKPIYVLAGVMGLILSLMIWPGQVLFILFSVVFIAVLLTPLWILAFVEHTVRKSSQKNSK